MNTKKEIERIITGIEHAQQFNRDYPWKEKGRDYSACYSKITFNELKKHLPDEIKNALEMAIKALEQASKEGKDIHLPLYNVGDRIEPGTDGNAYKLYMSNGKEFEKQPCKDAVSRQSVHDGMIKYGFHSSDMTITEFVEDVLHFVTPARKRGKWVKTGQSFVNPNKFLCYSCSECGSGAGKVKTKFCPNCGAEMQEVEE